MRYILNPCTDPHFNLALDEYCLQCLDNEDTVFYLWRNRPSVIIGLNQNAYSEVNIDYLRAHDITLARRVTGGGAVYHDLQNLNYTFVGRSVSPAPFVKALRSLGLDAELTGRNDIFVDGRKVSGYARRVWHDREIVHGTLMYNVDIDTLTRVLNAPGSKMEAKGIASVRSRVANLRDYLPQFANLDELQNELQSILSVAPSVVSGTDKIRFECNIEGQLLLSDSQLSEIREMAEQKFSTWEWVYGHSKEASWHKKARLACGTVEVCANLSAGRLVGIHFEGDFLGDRPCSELADALSGCRFEREDISQVLRTGALAMDSKVRLGHISEYFSGVNEDDFLQLLFA